MIKDAKSTSYLKYLNNNVIKQLYRNMYLEERFIAFLKFYFIIVLNFKIAQLIILTLMKYIFPTLKKSLRSIFKNLIYIFIFDTLWSFCKLRHYLKSKFIQNNFKKYLTNAFNFHKLHAEIETVVDSTFNVPEIKVYRLKLNYIFTSTIWLHSSPKRLQT